MDGFYRAGRGHQEDFVVAGSEDLAIDGLGVPFDIVQVAAQPVGYYVVAPEETADVPKIARFREWLMKAVS